MKIRIYISLILILVLSMMTLTSCRHIPDENGEDTSLARLTEEDILKPGTSYFAISSWKSYSGGSGSFSAESISGTYSVIVLKPEGRSITIDIDCELSSGNLRVVIINDGEIIKDIPLGKSSIVIDNPSGKYEIKLGAESANVKIAYTFTEAE